MKRKKVKVGIGILAGVLLVGLAAFTLYAISAPVMQEEYTAVMGDYDISGYYDFGDNEAYAVGMNAYGNPVFRDPDDALKAVKQDCKEAISHIRTHTPILLPLNRYNWQAYNNLAFDTPVGAEEVQRQKDYLGHFFSIYENGFFPCEGKSYPAPPHANEG